MSPNLYELAARRSAVRGFPSQALASSQLCRPHLRIVDPWPEIRLETSAVLSLAALSVNDGEIAIDGLLDSAAAGTTLDLNGVPVRVHATGDFSTAFDLQGRRTLTVTVTIPLTPAERELEDVAEARSW
jgi:hypothetical protein